MPNVEHILATDASLQAVATAITNLPNATQEAADAADAAAASATAAAATAVATANAAAEHIGDDLEIFTGNRNLVTSATWTNGKYLKNDGSISNVADMKVMALTAVPEGSYTLAIRATSPFASQALRFCGYDGSGTFVRLLGNFTAPTAAGVLKATINTTGCAQIRIAAGLYDAVAVYAGESIIEKVSAIETTLADKAPAIMNTTESSAIASFPDGAAGLPMALTVGIEPVQAGSGDPSPTNVRPITGWTGCNVVRTGKNLCGGEKLADNMVAAVGDASKCAKGTDSTGAYVTLTASSAISSKVFVEGCFKPSTRYTLIGKAKKNNTNVSSNLRFVYSDGTAGNIDIGASVTADTVYTFAATSSANKTLVRIVGVNASGITTFYYDGCGVFEGVLTASEFAPYTGTTLPVAFPSSAGTVYGGTLRIERDGSGTLTVDRVKLDLDSTSTWTKSSTYLGSFYKNRSAFSPPVPAYDVVNIICSHAARVNSISQYASGKLYIDGSVNLRIMSESASLQDWYDYLDAQKAGGTPVQLCYTIASPSTYALTPGQVLSILGNNRVWADCGPTKAEYAADTKLFIETRIAELQALVLENIGG